MPWTLFGFPFQVWAMMAVEFTERLGYYGAAFMLITYCTGLLKLSQSSGNAIVQGLYAMTPAAACVSSGLSDGYWGRPRALLVFMIAYAIGLWCIALSSYPMMYEEFPNGPLTSSYVLFGVGMVLFASGYGGMKVCTNPMMADSVMDVCADNDVKRDALLSRLFRWVYWVTNCGSLIGMIVAPLLRDLEPRLLTMGSREYTTGYYYGFSMSAASCVGGVILFSAMYRRFRVNQRAPAFVLFRLFALSLWVRARFSWSVLRDDDFYRAHKWDLIDFAGYGYRSRGDDVYDGSSTTVSTLLCGNTNGQTSGSSHDSGGSSPRFLIDVPTKSDTVGETVSGDDSHSSPADTVMSPREGLADVEEAILYEQMDTTCDDYDPEDIRSPGWIRDAKSTASVCKVLAPMPIYWLITNQSSTNMVLQAEATSRPASLPPEIFNIINTVALLLSILLLDRVVFPLLFGQRKPPVRGRVVFGFGVMAFTMVWCGVLQLYIDQRGSYDKWDKFVLNNGETAISSLWLIVPYVLQGTASALVDTTVMEVAYTMAPVRMKGAVMALYLVTSSISGFLGLALSPVMKPQNAAFLFFGLACALSVVAVLFAIFNGRTPRARHELQAEETHLLRRSGVHRTAPQSRRSCGGACPGSEDDSFGVTKK